MPAITLKNLPEGLHARLKLRARQHHRSLTGEVIAVLHEAVEKEGAPPEAPVLQAGQLTRSRRLPLPTFDSGKFVPAGFDLLAAIRSETAAADDAIARRLVAR